MRRLRTMDDIRLDGRVVLVRVDFNVSIGSDNTVDQFEDYRLEAALPTLKELQARRCKIILLTHSGQQHDDIGPIHQRLETLLGQSVQRSDTLAVAAVTSKVQKMKS